MSFLRVAVCLEVTPRQTFASALDWPGWDRAGRDEGTALEALDSYADRYAPVADRAGVSLPSPVASMSLSGCLAGPPPRSPHRNAAVRSPK